MKKYLVNINGIEQEVILHSINGATVRLEIDEDIFNVDITPILNKRTYQQNDNAPSIIINAGSPNTQAQGAILPPLDGGVYSPMPGIINKILVNLQDTVKLGQPIAIVEAMKMENSITAPCSGKVIEILVSSGQEVKKNELLVCIV